MKSHLEEIYKKAATLYGKHPNVDAVMLAGSVSRKLNDQFSDIEIYILWDREPADIDRKEFIKQLNGTVISFYDYEDEEWSEAYHVDGIKIEVSNFLSSSIRRILKEAAINTVIDIDIQCIASSVKDGVPLYGESLIKEFKQEVEVYPENLRRAMVESQLFFSSRWSARYTFINRKDFFLFQKVVMDVIEKMLLMLHGLNGMYVAHPGFKWLSYTLSEMKYKPINLESRIHEIIYSQTMDGVVDLERLLAETVDLIKIHMPSIDVSSFEKAIKITR